MSVEQNPVEKHLKQLADNFLEVIPDESGYPLRAKLSLKPPYFEYKDGQLRLAGYRTELIADPSARHDYEMFMANRFNDQGVTVYTEQATPQEIGELIGVARISDKVTPEFLKTLEGAARIRLLDMQSEIHRFLREI